VRSSDGQFKIYPCSTDGKTNMEPYEQITANIIESVYDEPKAYSLRDRDVLAEEALVSHAVGKLKSFLLHCCASENLLLSDEVLLRYKISFKDLEFQIKSWIERTSKIIEGLTEAEKKKEKTLIKQLRVMREFQISGYQRKTFDIKNVRNLLLVLFELAIDEKEQTRLDRDLAEDEKASINAPWEVIIGQVIGQLISSKIGPQKGENSILEYLGLEFGFEIFPDLVSRYRLLDCPIQKSSSCRGGGSSAASVAALQVIQHQPASVVAVKNSGEDSSIAVAPRNV